MSERNRKAYFHRHFANANFIKTALKPYLSFKSKIYTVVKICEILILIRV